MKLSDSTRWPRHLILWNLVKSETDADDLAHDHLHVLRVYEWAIRLAPEANADSDLTGAAALVHDLVNIPKEHRDRLCAPLWCHEAGVTLEALGQL